MSPPLGLGVPSPLTGWTMHQVEGKTYLGKPSVDPAADPGRYTAPTQVHLSPAYEFQFMALPTPQGMAMQPTLRNPWGCPSIRSLTLPRPGVWAALDALASDERKVF